jgi:hypothetical protein
MRGILLVIYVDWTTFLAANGTTMMICSWLPRWLPACLGKNVTIITFVSGREVGFKHSINGIKVKAGVKAGYISS